MIDVTNWIPWETDSETEICLKEVYWDGLLRLTSVGEWGRKIDQNEKFKLQCSSNKSISWFYREPGGGMALQRSRPLYPLHWPVIVYSFPSSPILPKGDMTLGKAVFQLGPSPKERFSWELLTAYMLSSWGNKCSISRGNMGGLPRHWL